MVQILRADLNEIIQKGARIFPSSINFNACSHGYGSSMILHALNGKDLYHIIVSDVWLRLYAIRHLRI